MESGKPHQIAVKSLFALFGIYPSKLKKYQELLQSHKRLQQQTLWWEVLKKIPPDKASYFAKNLEFSNSQFYQDLFIASELEGKRGGYFVEIGACDGVRLSNSLFFERHLGWNGILAEPAKVWHPSLQQNRLAKIETRAVWHTTGLKLLFNETVSKEVSTLDQFSFSDLHGDIRKNGQKYEVETISLNDMLDFYKAPLLVDYLSIDTEGSEFEILSNFDFKRRNFRCITCEHNFTKNRSKIKDLLEKNGYQQKYADFSELDDWYFLCV